MPDDLNSPAFRERQHFKACERAVRTGRAELAVLRGRPEYADREIQLRAGLKLIEAYLAHRWVR